MFANLRPEFLKSILTFNLDLNPDLDFYLDQALEFDPDHYLDYMPDLDFDPYLDLWIKAERIWALSKPELSLLN